MKVLSRARIGACAAAAIALASAPAHAAHTLYDDAPGQIETELEVLWLPADAGREFDDLDPVVLFGLGVGVYLPSGFRFLGGARADFTDDKADHIEGFVGLGWTSISAPDLGVPPALRIGARIETGIRWLELTGSDFVSENMAWTVALSGDIGLVPFDSFSLVARAGVAFAFGEGGAQPDPQIQLRVGLVFQALL